MKMLLTILFVLMAVFVFSMQAQADLQVRGTDSIGNQLIYDTDLNITWYDYTKAIDTWENINSWASNLTVNFNGTIYDDWALTVSTHFSPPYKDGYMRHLYYTELGNTGSGLNAGPFKNLQPIQYWQNRYFVGGSSFFDFYNGYEDIDTGLFYANGLAVRTGDVAVVPEPLCTILFLIGGATLIGTGYIRRKKVEV